MCNKKLVLRKDDDENTVKNRIKVFNSETAPLIDYYAKKGRLLRINADNSIEAVFENISALLSN